MLFETKCAGSSIARRRWLISSISSSWLLLMIRKQRRFLVLKTSKYLFKKPYTWPAGGSSEDKRNAAVEAVKQYCFVLESPFAQTAQGSNAKQDVLRTKIYITPRPSLSCQFGPSSTHPSLWFMEPLNSGGPPRRSWGSVISLSTLKASLWAQRRMIEGVELLIYALIMVECMYVWLSFEMVKVELFAYTYTRRKEKLSHHPHFNSIERMILNRSKINKYMKNEI
jgi:hypothetical protein